MKIVMKKTFMELLFRLCFVKLKLLLLAIEVSVMLEHNSDQMTSLQIMMHAILVIDLCVR